MKLSKNPSDYNTFILNSGYVESGSIGSLVVSHNFDSVEEAEEETWQEAWETSFNHFSSAFLTAAKLHNGIYVKDLDWARNISSCCEKQLDDEGASFCQKCGTALRKYRVKEVDKDRMLDMVTDFLATTINSTNDTWGSDYWELFSSIGWNVGFAVNPGIVSFVAENAECLLSDLDEFKTSCHWSEKKKFFSNVSFMRLSGL